MSITIQCLAQDNVAQEIIHLRNQSFSLENLDIKVHWVEPGTGYRIPEGIFAVLGRSLSRASESRAQIPADSIKEYILSMIQVSS